MTPPIQDENEKIAKELFSKINQSYMVFNKGAVHGINHNTQIVFHNLIKLALDSKDAYYEDDHLKLMMYRETHETSKKLCDILMNHVGETGQSEGAVEVLERKLAELSLHQKEMGEKEAYIKNIIKHLPLIMNDLQNICSEIYKADDFATTRGLLPTFYMLKIERQEAQVLLQFLECNL